jgi:hypothetical protein
MNTNPPEVVRRITDAVSERLGRPSHCRQVRNREAWYVSDPVLSFIQQGMKKGQTGYRVGYYYDGYDKSVWFNLVHAPVMAKLFKKNLVASSLFQILRSTTGYRAQNRIYRSSRHAMELSGVKDGCDVALESTNDFLGLLKRFDDQYGFVDDLFPTPKNTGKLGGKAPVAGNTFCLKLADKSALLQSATEVGRLVKLSWPLFLCLYPIKPLETRTAGLARNMRAKGIVKRCEFPSISLPLRTHINSLCRGEIQGAHIKPDSLGGSDRCENGLWLCAYHHRATEGKLKGRRSGDQIDVKYIDSSQLVTGEQS